MDLLAAVQAAVSVGGEVIGLSTAYYLASALGDGSSITIIDNAPELLLSASGLALGRLETEGFSDEVVSLGALSLDLHKDLAAQYDGRTNSAYTGLTVHRPRPKTAENTGEGRDEHPLPPWFKSSDSYVDGVVYTPKTSAQM